MPKFSHSTGRNAVMLLQQSTSQEHDIFAAVNNECIIYKIGANELFEKKKISVDISGSDGYITAFHQCGNLLILATSEGSFWPVKLPAFKALDKIVLCQNNEINGVHIDKNVNWAAFCTANHVYLVDLKTYKVVREIENQNGFEYRCVTWLPDKDQVIVVSNSIKRDCAIISIYDCDLSLCKRSKINCRPITCLMIRNLGYPDKECQYLCVFGTADGSVGFLKLPSLYLEVILGQVQDFPITSVSADHDASIVFATSANGTVSVLKNRNRYRSRLATIFVASIIVLLFTMVLFAYMKMK